MRTSEDGIDLIKHFEGCKLTAYKDVGGRLTVGFGHCDPTVEPGMVISPERADELLLQDVRLAENALFDLVGDLPLLQGEFDALVSFIFNLGVKRLARSTLLKKLTGGDKAGAADEFLRWTHVGSTFNRGLATRRAAEREMFKAPR